MSKLKLLVIAALFLPAQALAEGSVVKALRPELRTFDDKASPWGR